MWILFHTVFSSLNLGFRYIVDLLIEFLAVELKKSLILFSFDHLNFYELGLIMLYYLIF